MKRLLLIFAITTCHLTALVATPVAETNIVYQQLLQASNNPQKIIELLPDVEKLWPGHPEAYLKSVDLASHVLSKKLKATKNKKEFLYEFDSVMRKPIPTNEVEATKWVKLKTDLILYFLSFDEIKNSKTSWLSIAKFVGEIRSQIIPNYRNQYMMLSISVMDPIEREKIVRENEKKRIPDDFQRELNFANRSLTGQIELVSPCFLPGKSVDPNFKKAMIANAHLTDEDFKEMDMIFNPTNN